MQGLISAYRLRMAMAKPHFGSITTSRQCQTQKTIVLKLQKSMQSQFDEASASIKDELAEKDEDEIDDFIKKKFGSVRNEFNTHINEMEAEVLAKRPKKPKREYCSSDTEYQSQMKTYEKEKEDYKAYVNWISSVLDKLKDWLSDLLEKIKSFFRSVWNWIKQKFQQVATKVKEFIQFVGKKIKSLYNYLFD